MSNDSKMIFYDKRQKRKWYFRGITLTFFGLLLSGFIIIALSIVNAKSALDFLDQTAEYYDYYYTPVNNKKIVLTFDDGPHPVHTEQIMEILKNQNVPATFFFLGENALRYADIVKEASDNGFTIGTHSFTHSKDVHESEQRLKLELVTSGKVIEKITGETPLFYRPPFLLNIGNDPTMNPYIDSQKPLIWSTRQGFIPIGADIDSKDWLVSSSEAALENVRKGLDAGHILLLHDGFGGGPNNTIPILEELILELKADGYEFSSLSEVLGITKNINIRHDFFSGTSDETSGGRVSELQKFLREEEGQNIKVTGYYDIPTSEAVLKWEKKYGIDLKHDYQLPSHDENTEGEVSVLQRFLKDQGAKGLAVTGYYDPQTMNAVRQWQEVHTNITSDSSEYGLVGEKTRSAIAEISRTLPNYYEHQKDSVQHYMHRIFTSLEYGYMDFITSIGPVVLMIIELIFALVIFRTSFVFLLLAYSFIKKRRVPKVPYRGPVTAIVPAYNEEDNVASTIYSLLQNKVHQLEIIVVDDGSTDNTASVVKEIQKRHPHIVRLIQVENGGKARALNIGFQEASHEVIVAMDGDTIYTENTIEKLVRHFSDETIGAVAGKVCVVEHNNILGMFQAIEYIIGQNIEKQAFAAANAVGVVPGPVGAWRKSAVIAVGGYSTDTLVEDQDLTLSILHSGMKVLYEPEAIALTETPPTVRDFIKQRFRWVFGTMQCFWKYKKSIGTLKTPSLGWLVLPNIALYNTVIPLFSPLADILAIITIIFGGGDGVLEVYLLFTLFDLFYASLAFRGERKNIKLLFVLPFQRLFYRQIMYYIIIKSIIKAIEGTHALWNKVRRTGQAQKYFNEAASQQKA